MSRYVRKSDRGITDWNALVTAIKEVKLDNKSIRSTAKAHNIPKSSLARYIQKVNDTMKDISTIDGEALLKLVKSVASYATPLMVFSPEQEEVLVAYIKRCCDHYYGLSISDLRLLAYQFANRIDARYPPSWEENRTAGRDWYYSFMQRHPLLTLRTPEQTSLNRMKGFCKENVSQFFGYLDNVLAIHQFRPSNIWNMDETGFSTVPSKIGKVISILGVKKVGIMSSAERGTMISMALAVNAEGNSIPPYFLFPTKKMQGWYMDDASPGAVGYVNESGWMCQPDFVKYMRHFVERSNSSLNNPTLLLIDNHCLHLSIEALDMAVENGVTLLSFPPHCSHKLQPLDVSVYGPVKTYYKSQCNAWQKTNANKVIEIRHIMSLVRKTLDLALTPRNIKAGFQATGISPYNPDIFVDSDFVQAVINSENEAVVAAEPEEVNNESQRRIVINVPEVAAHEEANTSKTSSTSILPHESHLSSILSSIGPLQTSTPAKKSNRGRKSMKSCILTSPENISELKEKQIKRIAAKEKASANKEKKKLKREEPTRKQPARKQAKKKLSSSSPSDDDTDDDEDAHFCIICIKIMPRKLSRYNSIECNTCKRAVHLKCANMQNSFFTCKNCESD